MPSALHTIERNCRECAKPLVFRIMRDIERKWFCSQSCRSRFTGRVTDNIAIDEIRACSWCKQSFHVTRSRHIFCSKTCQCAAATRRCEQADPSLESYVRRLLRTNSRKHLTVDSVVAMFDQQKGRCAITGELMTFIRRQGRIMTNMSLDRIDSGRGYEPENVHLVCLVVNLMKNALSMDEFMLWCIRVVEGSKCQVLRENSAS